MEIYPIEGGEFLVTPADKNEAQIIADASYEAAVEIVRASHDGLSSFDRTITANLMQIANDVAKEQSFRVDVNGKKALRAALSMYKLRGEALESATQASELGLYTHYRGTQRERAGKLLGTAGLESVN